MAGKYTSTQALRSYVDAQTTQIDRNLAPVPVAGRRSAGLRRHASVGRTKSKETVMTESQHPQQDEQAAEPPWEDTIPMGNPQPQHHSAAHRHRRHVVANTVQAIRNALSWVSRTVFNRSRRHAQRRRAHALKRRQGLPNLQHSTERHTHGRRYLTRRQDDRDYLGSAMVGSKAGRTARNRS